MRYLSWLLRVVLFVFLLGLAVKNNQPVTLHYFFGYEWESTQVIVLLVFFSAGAVLGVLSMLVRLLKLRREVGRLKRDIKLMKDIGEKTGEYQVPIQPS